MTLARQSGCKVNLLLNILGRRPDGFHELETVIQPIALFDDLEFTRGGTGIRLTCNDSSLPVDADNLVHRATSAFLEEARIQEGVSIRLEKRIPLAAGLGGGSGNAAATLLGLNELFGQPLAKDELNRLAARLGSDVPFFLQSRPALATGRGEQIASVEPFAALRGVHVLLIHPGFGISTAWAYQRLAAFPEALNGRPGRGRELVAALQDSDLRKAAPSFYNSLEAPAFDKYPILALFQEFLRCEGVVGTLMSGSGSTTFALLENRPAAENLVEKFKARFGQRNWTAVVPL